MGQTQPQHTEREQKGSLSRGWGCSTDGEEQGHRVVQGKSAGKEQEP